MPTEKPSEAVEKKPFLSTLPGILTATAAVITALAGLVVALGPTGLLGSRGAEPPTATGGRVESPASVPAITTTGDRSPVVTGTGGDVSVTIGK